MSERKNKTLICSVLLVDIADSSLAPLSEQIKLKEELNVLLNDALKNVAPSDRVVVDTGAGAVISFSGDPEGALSTALSLRDSTVKKAEAHDALPMNLRMGIHLGPVLLVKDPNGRLSVIGDGVNVAQRIMAYTSPGQVLVSRSYFEVVSRIAGELARFFRYEGAHTDTGDREHELYEVVGRSDELKRLENDATRSWRSRSRRKKVIEHLARAGAALRAHLSPRAALSAAILVSAVFAAEIAVSLHRSPLNQADATQRGPGAPQSSTAALLASTEVHFAISPWGQVIVDGVKRGASPPLLEVKLAPGEHKVEIQNGRYPPLVAAVDARPGSVILIKHAFR